MLAFSGMFRSPIVIFDIISVVTHFLIDTRGSFDKTSAETHVVEGRNGGLWWFG